MENSSRKPKTAGDLKAAIRRPGPNMWVLLVIVGVMAMAVFFSQSPRRSTIPYSVFLDQLDKSNVAYVQLGDQDGNGVFQQPPPEFDWIDADGSVKKGDPKQPLRKHFRVVLPRESESRAKLTSLLKDKGVKWENEAPSNALLMFYMLVLLVPLALFAFFWFSYRRTRDQMMGGGFLTGFSKSPAKRYEAVSQPVTFKDVAGLEGVKARPGGDRRVPAEPGEVPAPGWACAQGRAAQRTAGHRQDVAGPRRGR